MRNKIISASVALGAYLLFGALFFGNHFWILPSVLVTISLFIFFFNREKSATEKRENILWAGIPFLLVLLITSFFVDAFSVVIWYVLGVVGTLLCVYFLLQTHDKSKQVACLLGAFGVMAVCMYGLQASGSFPSGGLLAYVSAVFN